MERLIFLTALVFLFNLSAHAHPQPAKTLTVVPIPAAASPFPGKPTANEFKYENFDEKSDVDKADRETIHRAFTPWAMVIQKARESLLDHDDDTYDRWFPKNVKKPDGGPSLDGRGYVTGIFAQMHKFNTESPEPLPLISTLIADKSDFSKQCAPRTNAYMSPTSGRFHVCKPKGLSQITAATDVDCTKLGVRVSRDMQSLTGTLIHEFLHWDRVGSDYPKSVGEIVDVEYGPSGCAILASGNRERQQRTFINADSYKWFALNAYYNSVCKKKFTDPKVTKEDLVDSKAELLESPLYKDNPVDDLVDSISGLLGLKGSGH